MESPLFDFRAALSGTEPEPPGPEEEPALGEQGSPAATSRADAAPVSVDLTSGLLLLRHGSASVQVDTATQDAVLDPGGSAVAVDGDGVMLLGTRRDEATASSHLLPGEEVTRTVSVTEPETDDVSGQGLPGVEARTASVPAEPVIAAEPESTGETTALVSEPLSTYASVPLAPRGPLLEGTRTDSGEPVTDAVPISAGTGDPAHGGSGAEDGDAGAPAVTLDPETGVTTVEAGDLKFVMDADTGTISIEPGDRHVPLDPEAAPVTIETGTLRLTIDPDTGTVGIDTVEPEEGEEALPTTIEIGGLRLTLDPETGEVTLDPGDGEMEVDPDTGLITVSEKPGGDAGDGDGGPDGDGEERASGDDGPGRDGHTGDFGKPGGESSGGDGADGDRTSGDVPRTPTQTAGSPDGVVGQTPGTPLSPLTPPLSSTPPEEQDHSGDTSDGPVVPGGEYTPTTPVPGAVEEAVSREPVQSAESPVGTPDGIPEESMEAVGEHLPTASLPGTAEEPVQLADPSPARSSSGPVVPGGEYTPTSLIPKTTEQPPEAVGEHTTASVPDPAVKTSSDGPVTPGGEYTPTTPIPGTTDKPMEALVNHVPGDGDGDKGRKEDNWDKDEDNKEDDKDGEESNGNEKGKSGEATRIDLDQLKDFRKKFVIPLRERVSEEVTRFAPYQNAGGGGGSAQPHILIGNAKFLEPAGLLSSEIDTSLATLYGILTDLESELGLIEDRLHENMTAFVNLEDEQNLSAQDVVNLIGSPSVGASASSGYGNGYSNEEPAGETDDES